MNLFVVAAIVALLVGLLYVLGLWQRRVEEAEEKRVSASIRETRDLGAERPAAQHPRIDVQACIGCGSCVAACPEDEVLGLVDGVAHVIHGSRCIGHGLCAEACPVAAITIGLHDLASRPDIPVLSARLETSVAGVSIAGELGGFALIRVAVEQGTRVIECIAEELRTLRRPTPDGGPVDVLIVGAGPAGLAAALKAVELGLSYVAIDREPDIGGTVRKYPRRKLTLTGPLELPLHGRVDRHEFLKEELIEFWEELIERHRLDIRTGIQLHGVERCNGLLVAETSAGAVAARRVVLALGRRGTPRKLGVPGEEHEKVLYQLIGAATYNDERILVVGGGDSAVEAATALADQSGNEVTLSYRRDRFFRLKPRNRERIERYTKEGAVRVIFNSNVVRIDLERVELSRATDGGRETLTLENDYVLVFAGGEPPYELLRKIGVLLGVDAEQAQVDTPEPARVAG